MGREEKKRIGRGEEKKKRIGRGEEKKKRRRVKRKRKV